MCEGGRDEEGEDERGERPEGPVEVRRGREVGGGVRWGEGVERVEAAEEDLKRTRKLLCSTGKCADVRFWCRRRNGVGSSRHSRKTHCWRQRCSL